MATIKQYSKKDGSKAWMFKAYLGINEDTGKQMFTTRRGFASKKECQIAFNRLKVEVEDKGFTQGKQNTLTFNEVYDMWVINYELTVKESTFVKQTEQYRLHILPVFGDTVLDRITPAMVQKFANDNVNKFARYREFISNTSRIFDYAIKIDLIKENPCKKITIPSAKKDVKKEKKANYLSKNELKIFLEILNNHENKKIATFLRLLALSGARVGEILGLEWRSVNFEDGYISITQTLARGKNRRLYLEAPKTAGSVRDVPLDPTTIQWLKKWKMYQKRELLESGFNSIHPNQLVFSSSENNSFLQLSKPRKWLDTILKNSNLTRITIHGLRHTYATMMLESGLTLKDVSERLGHSSIEITSDLYIHITKKRKHDSTDQVMNYLTQN